MFDVAKRFYEGARRVLAATSLLGGRRKNAKSGKSEEDVKADALSKEEGFARPMERNPQDSAEVNGPRKY